MSCRCDDIGTGNCANVTVVFDGQNITLSAYDEVHFVVSSRSVYSSHMILLSLSPRVVTMLLCLSFNAYS